MGKKSKIYTPLQWDYEADNGLVWETSCPNVGGQTNIICTHVIDDAGRVCGTLLWDLPLLFNENLQRFGIKPRRAVGCKECGWIGSRSIAKGKF